MQEAIITWGLSGFILILFIGILSFVVYMVKYG